jgi:hypothetical protein
MSSKISFVRDIRIDLPPGRILARLGRGRAEPGAKWNAEAAWAAARVLERAEPVIAYRRLSVAGISPGLVTLEGACFRSADLASRLSGCVSCTLFALTVGCGVDAAVDELAPDVSRQVLVDAAASEAAESCARWLSRSEAAVARAHGCRALPRFSPGYGDFGLDNQLWFVENLGGLGMSIAASGMILPRKSITGVIGWLKG